MSQLNKYPLEQALQKAFEDSEVDVPEMVWENIEQATIKSQKPNRRFLFFILGLLLMSATLFSYFIIKNNNIKSISIKKVNTDKTVKNIIANATDTAVLPNQNMVLQNNNNPTTKTFESNNNLVNKSSVDQFQSKSNVYLQTSKMNVTPLNIERTNSNTINEFEIQDIFPTSFPITKLENKAIESRFIPSSPQAMLKNISQKLLAGIPMEITRQSNKSISSKSPIMFVLNFGKTYFDVQQYQPFLRAGTLSNIISNTNGLNIGFKIQKQLKPKHSLSIGLLFAQKNINLYTTVYTNANTFSNYHHHNAAINLEELNKLDCSQLFTIKNALLSYRNQSLWLPLQYGYTIASKRKFSIQGQVGLQPNLLFKNQMNSNSDFNAVAKQSSMLKLLNGSVGLDLHYQATKNIQIGISPSFQKEIYGNTQTVYKLNQEVYIPVSIRLQR